MQTGAAYFNELWTSRDTDDAQRTVLQLLAGRDGVISEDELLNRARLENSAPLKRLLWRDVIEQTDSGYRLRARLVGRWIRERAL